MEGLRALWILPPTVQLGSHSGYGRKLTFCLWLGKRKSSHFEICQSTLLLNRVSAHRRNYLTGALPAGVFIRPGGRETAPAASDHAIPLKKGLENKKWKLKNEMFFIWVWGSQPKYKSTKRLRPTHETIEIFPSPHTSPHHQRLIYSSSFYPVYPFPLPEKNYKTL